MSDTPKIQISAGTIAAVFLLVLVILGGASSVYQVDTDSQAVILRFGKFDRIEEPGLNFKLPFLIEREIIVPVKRRLTVEFGSGSPQNTNPYQHSGSMLPRRQAEEEFQRERDMVTGDLNSVWVEWNVQYYVVDVKDYLFKVDKPELALRDAAESVMRDVVGDRSVDEVLTIGRQAMEVEAKEKLQKLVKFYEMGFMIELVQLTRVNPPSSVKASFDEVNSAEAEKDRTVNLARREYNSVVPQAEGQANQRISEAEGYALRRKNEAIGDVNRFQSLFAEYEKAPEVTKRRIYLETMSEVLPLVGKKIIIDDEAKQILPLLNLNQGK